MSKPNLNSGRGLFLPLYILLGSLIYNSASYVIRLTCVLEECSENIQCSPRNVVEYNEAYTENTVLSKCSELFSAGALRGNFCFLFSTYLYADPTTFLIHLKLLWQRKNYSYRGFFLLSWTLMLHLQNSLCLYLPLSPYSLILFHFSFFFCDSVDLKQKWWWWLVS